MTLHLYFILKLSADVFGNLALTLLAQRSFKEFKTSGSNGHAHLDSVKGQKIVYLNSAVKIN
jgi:hypothetical protein